MLFFSIISLEIFIVFKHSDSTIWDYLDVFDNAYIDETGQFLLGGLFAVFLIYFVKIGISDIVRKIKGQNKATKQMLDNKKTDIEPAKLTEECCSTIKEWW